VAASYMDMGEKVFIKIPEDPVSREPLVAAS
jgi:hypothetical protein